MRNATLVCILSMIGLFNCQPQTDLSSTNFSSAQIQLLDSFIANAYSAFPLPGLSVAIVKDNTVYTNTKSKTNDTGHYLLTDSTQLSMGSISELMVATAILKLVELEKISLDDPIVKHLPYFKLGDDLYQTITIKNMLTHSSGIPHHAATWDLPSYDEQALEMTTRSIEHQPVEYKPGSEILRAQYDYDILADLIGKVTGIPFEDYIRKNVFDPLGMTNSTFYYQNIPTSQVAKPHKIANWLTYAFTEEEVYPYNREYAGSTGFHTSIKDITRWMMMVLNNGKTADDKQFLNKKLLTDFLKPVYKTNENHYIGLGWEIEKKNDVHLLSKNFNLNGFSADLVIIPEQHIGVLAFSNISGDFNPSVINDQIINYLNGEQLKPLKTPVSLAMGQKFESTKNLDSAFQIYNDLKRTNNNQYSYRPEDVSQLGVNMLYRLHDVDNAKRVFDFIIQEYPSSPSALLNLAETHVLENELTMANTILSDVKEMKPDSPDVPARLAYLEKELGMRMENLQTNK